MTPTEQLNLAIAESEGWAQIENMNSMAVNGIWVGYPRVFMLGQKARIPNFVGDLNLMHDLEKKLPIQEQGEYWNYLASIATGFSEDDFDSNNEFLCFEVINATAAQRAEAYAKVKGIWHD